MMYAKYRWRNRLTRWLFDDPRWDRTVNETVQSVNHLCFSPQYYFIMTYFTWGIVLQLLAITIFCRAEQNPLADPALFYFIFQQALANKVLDKLVRLISFVIWQPPPASVAAKKFYREITRSLKQKKQELHSHMWRSSFTKEHKGWILGHLDEVFTPRSIARYKEDLTASYSQIINLTAEQQYQVILEQNVDEEEFMRYYHVL